MKTFYTVLKILAALIAIAGVVYVVINYGDRIAAWCKKTVAKFFPGRVCCCEDFEDCDEPAFAEDFEG